MLDAIRSIFSRAEDGRQAEHESGADVDPLHLAACALLLDVAFSDGEFSDPERKHLEEVLARHFGLSPEQGQRLLKVADVERRKAVDYFHFTSQLQRGYDLGQKMVLAEVMWGLVLADGMIADHEHYLTRQITILLELEPAYLSTAKAAAAEKAEKAGRSPQG
jgi:uncharacterized tellurite resistance protein B-like protein